MAQSLDVTGDSPSLWNVTRAPGWTVEETQTLRLALMTFGIGKWALITGCGCLPGKTVSQLSRQTQLLLGQQSLAEFVGLRLDPTPVKAKNDLNKDAFRKNGCIINTGKNPTREETLRKREDNEKKYGLAENAPEVLAARTQLDAVIAGLRSSGPGAVASRVPLGAPPPRKPECTDVERLELKRRRILEELARREQLDAAAPGKESAKKVKA